MDQRRGGCEAGCPQVIGGRGWLQDSEGRASWLVMLVRDPGGRSMRIQALRQDSGHQTGLWGLIAPCS